MCNRSVVAPNDRYANTLQLHPTTQEPLTVRIRSRGLGAPADEVEITFAGRPLRARATDTIASALTAAGELACRETLDGDHRGLFCGMGVCQECLVSVDGEPGQRACMTPVRAGHARRSPAGTAGSRRPRRRTRRRRRRRLALPRHPPRPKPEPRELSCELLVVGGGPAGPRGGGRGSRGRHLQVVLADERPEARRPVLQAAARGARRRPREARSAVPLRAFADRTSARSRRRPAQRPPGLGRTERARSCWRPTPTARSRCARAR